MRKFFLAIASTVAMMAVAIADPVRVVKFDEGTKTLTVKGAKKTETDEKEYKLTDKVKFTQGKNEITLDKAVAILSSPKAPKAIDITLDKDGKIEAVKFGGGKGKGKTEPVKP